MTRFAWLQSRTQTLTTVAVLAALAIAATITGVHLAHLYNSLVAHCQIGCGLADNRFTSHQRFLQHGFDILTQAAPALFGIFWGAPLVAREFESGTFRLAWTQSVTRSRWLLTKLAVGGGTTLTIAGLLTLTITWWYRSLDQVGTNQYAVFDRRDLVPIGYAVFAFAAGALIGAVIRRTLPAMATTLGVYIFTRIATALWVRPHLLSPLHKTTSITDADQFGFMSENGEPVQLVAQGAAPPNAWRLSSHFVTNAGHRVTSGQLTTFMHQYCPSIGAPTSAPGNGVTGAGGPQAFHACREQAAKTFHLLVTYQPANRYWTFQWLETAIFLMLAVLCAIGCYWWLTRRVTQ